MIKKRNTSLNKHVLALFMILIFTLIFTVSVVSAADHTIDPTTPGGINQGITDTGSGDVLTLEQGTYNKGIDDRAIYISKDITIQGNGPADKVIIDAGSASRIFNIGDGYTVIFMNITFMNGFAPRDGAAVINNYNGTSMTFINCLFINNTVTFGYGGAIYNKVISM